MEKMGSKSLLYVSTAGMSCIGNVRNALRQWQSSDNKRQRSNFGPVHVIFEQTEVSPHAMPGKKYAQDPSEIHMRRAQSQLVVAETSTGQTRPVIMSKLLNFVAE
jgi:hypothetical protein